MRCFLPRGWIWICVFIALLACGCRHSRCCPWSCCTRSVPSAAPNTAKPVPLPAAKPRVAPAPPPPPSAAAQPTALQAVPAPFSDAPPHPRFAHARDYRWLVGKLDYSRIQKAWLLRYVSFEEEDRYGGCVTLVAPPSIRNFKPGQIVRVEGSLIDPNSHQLRPAYQVRSLRAE